MALSPEFCIVATPAQAPLEIERSRWPAHITVVGSFRVEEDAAAKLPELVQRAVMGLGPIQVTLGQPALFGSDAALPVLLVEHPVLSSLHASLADALAGTEGLVMSEPAFWHDGYRAHLTLGRAVTAAEGDAMRLTRISLVSLRGEWARRRFESVLG